MISTTTSLNQHWLFSARDDAAFARPRASEHGFAPVHLPHSNVELPANLFSERRAQFISWYRKHLPTPVIDDGSRVLLDFDGVMMVAEVYVNGLLAGTHRGGYVGFTLDITDLLRKPAGTENVLAVRVDSRLHDDIPPCGHVMDYQTFGGIYRDVRLRVVPACYMADLFARTPQPLALRKTLAATVTLCNTGGDEWHGTAQLELCTLAGRRLARGTATDCRIPAHEAGAVELEMRELERIELWTLEAPKLYLARVTVREGGRLVDRREARIGFREARLHPARPFMLNGKPHQAARP